MMTDLFDKNGNATETHTVRVSGFSPDGEFESTYDVRVLAGTGIPGFSTMSIAPVADDGFAVCWDGKDWNQVEDLRGKTAYKKSDLTSEMIRTLGPLDDEYTLLAPTTPYDKWDGTQWITDAAAQHAIDVTSAEAQKLQLIDQANAYMNSKQWPGKAAMGRLNDTDKAQYNLWLDYLDALDAVKTTSAPDINWPIPPEV